MPRKHHRSAAGLLDYLRRHPNARDTLEGIAKFWLGEDTTDKTREEIEKAVMDLIEEGWMERRLKPDGEWLYGLAEGKRDQPAEDEP